jgi:hypothetical protein
MLREMGAKDVQHAFDRACLQGKLDTARQLCAMGARVTPGSVMGPCETLNDAGLALLLDMGAELADEHGDRLAPVALILQTYSRYPEGKHRCLELAAGRGVELPDTPVMAVHRGRIDLLEALLKRDSQMLGRTFSHEEIYPPALGCSADPSYALHGTPLAGTTLLHICVDFDDIEIARWLIERDSADTRRCSDAWCRRRICAGVSGMRSSRGCCWITGRIRMRERRCGSGCGLCRTNLCMNIAMSRPWLGESAFMDRGRRGTPG